MDLDQVFKGSREEVVAYISNRFNLMEFQIEMLYDLYSELVNICSSRNMPEDYVKSHKNQIFRRITNGDCNKKEVIERMAKDYCKKILNKGKSEALTFLIGRCEMSEDNARKFYESYIKIDAKENQMLSEELDTNNLVVQRNDMINDIYKKVYDSKKVLEKTPTE
ncbi:MAG: hypothetical protein PUA90_04865 [bacterium]|nr:hypothetical protein [bacterium]